MEIHEILSIYDTVCLNVYQMFSTLHYCIQVANILNALRATARHVPYVSYVRDVRKSPTESCLEHRTWLHDIYKTPEYATKCECRNWLCRNE